MVERWAGKISLAPFDQNTAAHTSRKDTHTEELPYIIPKHTSGPLLQGPGEAAWDKAGWPLLLHTPHVTPRPGSSWAGGPQRDPR